MKSTTRDAGLSIGVKLLDGDHWAISEALSELQTAVFMDEDRRRTGSLLRKLARLNLTHFALEEGIMVATQYPGLAQHNLRHQWLNEQMDLLVQRYARSRAALDSSSLNFLFESHLIHVSKDDLDFGDWLTQMDLG
jgi:hemerythrin-like metal-binding protein